MHTKLSVFSIVLLLACGGGGGTMNVSKMVTKAAGGTVTVGAGAALAIPANSLSGDVTITAAVTAPPSSLPNQDTLKGMYYDFGPSGTTFNPPASLSLPSPGTPPAGSMAVISWFDATANKWTDLPTESSSGLVTASVSHFTGFVVRWVLKFSVALDCTAAKTAACGGNLVGTWKWGAICPAPAPQTKMFDTCTDSNAVLTTTVDGTATFNADLSYSLNLTTVNSGTVHVSAACMSMLQLADCAAVKTKIMTGTKPPNATCAAATGGCDCDLTDPAGPMQVAVETGSYAVATATNSFTTTKTGGTAGNPTPYCIDGNNIWVPMAQDGTTWGFVKQ